MTHVKASFIIDRAQHCNAYIASIPGFECLNLLFVCFYIINFIYENRHYWGKNQEGIELLEEHTSSPLLSSSLTTVMAVNHSEGSSQNNCSFPPTNISMARWVPMRSFLTSLFLELLFSGIFLNWGGLIRKSTKPCEDTGPWLFKSRFMGASVTSQIISSSGFTPLGISQWRKGGLWLPEEWMMIPS